MAHLVLLGDSILDNAAYTAGGPAVIDHLRARLPPGWQATLLAVDGSITTDVVTQLRHLPQDATHLVISAGGNDALMQSNIIEAPATSVAQVLQQLSGLGQEFTQAYQAMLQAILQQQLPTALCTIYYPNFPDPTLQAVMAAGLLVFNDVIFTAAIGAGLPLLDLRLVCTSPDDYANPIEPSAAGGAKIADALLRLVIQHDFAQSRTTIFV